MNEQDKNRLIDMRRAAKRAVNFVDGKSRADLEADDELLGFAVVRAIEVIGEAANQVTPETRDILPMIAWRNIIGMRNRIVHDYLHVDYDIVWQVVVTNLPELIAQLNTILDADDVV